jgi:hypothetical protein
MKVSFGSIPTIYRSPILPMGRFGHRLATQPAKTCVRRYQVLKDSAFMSE